MVFTVMNAILYLLEFFLYVVYSNLGRTTSARGSVRVLQELKRKRKANNNKKKKHTKTSMKEEEKHRELKKKKRKWLQLLTRTVSKAKEQQRHSVEISGAEQ